MTGAAGHARGLLFPAIVGVAARAVLFSVRHCRKDDVGVREQRGVGQTPVVRVGDAGRELIGAAMEPMHLAHDRIRRVAIRVVAGVASFDGQRVDVEVANGARERAWVAVVHVEMAIHRALVAARAGRSGGRSRCVRTHHCRSELQLCRDRKLVDWIRTAEEEQHRIGACGLGGDGAELVAEAAVRLDRQVGQGRVGVTRRLEIDVVVSGDSAIGREVEEGASRGCRESPPWPVR